VSATFLPFVKDCCTYVTVNGSDYNGTDHHDPIRQRNVNLSMESSTRVSGLDLRKVGRMHELYEQLESAGNECLRSNDSSED
jgi:hypothetical protein